MLRLEEGIRAEARRLGFARCAFARVEPPAHRAFVERWLGEGKAGEMAYIERGLAKRFDPALVLPQVRSIITLGVRYAPPPAPEIDWRGELRGRIAAYAFGTDYHENIGAMLEGLVARLCQLQPGALARAYVDTGPVLEREWAAAAGIGWFGKNTNILHTDDGSWFFLAEVLTNLDLEPDDPIGDHCGTCTRCLDLCPTGALEPGYHLDARLCISYLTIEHRGSIPAELRPRIGSWIFGCDVCQEVCPWNERLARRQGTGAAAELFPRLPDLLQLDEKGFRQRFRHSAVRRAKRDGLVRNVAVVLGNTGNAAALVPLAAALRHDASALVRAHAAWGIGQLGGAQARHALDAAYRHEESADVRREIVAALEEGASGT